jgi:hypothetical protein
MTAECERLPNRRESQTYEIVATGMKYRATISRFADGRLAEIFLSNHKTGSDADTAAKDSAIVCALMRDGQRRPNGSLGIAPYLLVDEDLSIEGGTS